MSISLITAGIIFLLNPGVWIWDILPDFIGAFLIMLGIKSIVFLNGSTRELYRRLWYVALVGMAKSGLSIVLFNASGNIKVLVSFIFAVLELIILAPATAHLLRTLESLQDRYYPADSNIPESRLPRVSVFVSIYFFLRALIVFSPEIAELSTLGRYGSTIRDESYNIVDSKWAVYLLALFVALILFAVILALLIPAMVRYGKDKETPSSAVCAAEKIKSSDIAAWQSEKWSIVRVPFTVAAVLSVFVFIDGVDYLPKAMAAIVITVLSFIYSKRLFERIVAIVAGVLVSVSSYLSNLRLAAYFAEYKNESATMWSDNAKKMYNEITVLLIIEAALLFAAILLMTEILKKARVSELKEHGFKSWIKPFKRQMLALQISTVLPLAATIAYPFLRPASPELAFPMLLSAGAVVVVFAVRVDFDQSREKSKSGHGSGKSIYRDEGIRAQEINYGYKKLGK